MQSEGNGDVLRQPIRPTSNFPEKISSPYALDLERQFGVRRADGVIWSLRIE